MLPKLIEFLILFRNNKFQRENMLKALVLLSVFVKLFHGFVAYFDFNVCVSVIHQN